MYRLFLEFYKKFEALKKDLPKGFQTAEFVLEHGFLDFIVDRKEMKAKLSSFIKMVM